MGGVVDLWWTFFVREGVIDFIYRCCICRVKPVKGTGHMIVLGVFVMIRNSWRELLSVVPFLGIPSSPITPSKNKEKKGENRIYLFFAAFTLGVHVQLTLAFGIWQAAIMACSCILSGYPSTTKLQILFWLLPCSCFLCLLSLLLLPSFCSVLCCGVLTQSALGSRSVVVIQLGKELKLLCARWKGYLYMQSYKLSCQQLGVG